MRLAEVLDGCLVCGGPLPAVDVRGIAFDSRRVRPGDLFFAVHGVRQDGSLHIGEAISRGAVAVVAQSGTEDAGECIYVEDMRIALGTASANFYGNPSRSLDVFAVTGTNGKTTVAGLVRDILSASGRPCGLISTVEIAYPGHREEASMTTPDPPALHRTLADMLRAGCRAVSMEASSHALHQRRTAGVRYAAAGFTNLSRDHLDYHADFEDYFRAKSLLFEGIAAENPGGASVVNADDAYGARLLEMLRARGAKVLAYSIGGGGDIVAEDVSLDSRGSSFTIRAFGGSARVESGLLGRYNVSNMLCAAGMALSAGIGLDVVAATLSSSRPRWGRLEKVGEIRGASVFVDYAHTPDAIDKVLTALREITLGRLGIVFGCGGDRDKVKRPQMADIASRNADWCVLTSDNPRTEDPEAIMDDAEAGFSGNACPHLRIADRREAIKAAIDRLGEGDTLVIAGKGHETYQDIQGVKHPFDDRAVVIELCHMV